MVRLKWLKIQGFRSFREETYISFPDSGLVLIGGDSGSGKSTILLAIAYILDICPPKYTATSLANWDNVPLQVYAGFDYDGVEVTMGRGKRTFVKVGGVEKTGTAAYKEEQRRIFGVGPELLSSMVYRAQKGDGLFLSKVDSQKKEFLSSVLNLGELESVADVANENAKAKAQELVGIDSSIVRIDHELEVIQSTVIKTPTDVSALEALLRSQTALIATSRALVDAIQKERSELEGKYENEQKVEIDKHKEKLLQATTFLNQSKDSDSARKTKYDAEIEDLRQKLRTWDGAILQCNQLKLNKTQKLKELEQVKAGKCPTCARQWEASQKHQKELEDALANIENNLAGEFTFQTQRAAIETQIKGNVFVPDPNLAKLTDIVQKLTTEIEVLKNKSKNAVIREIYEKEHKAISDLNALNSKYLETMRQIDVQKAQNEGIQELHNNMLEHVKRLNVDRSGALVKQVATQFEMNAEKDFYLALGREGFLGVIFEEILSEIAREANLRMGRLSNTSNVTIDFRIEQSGNVKKAIVPVITVGGHETKFDTGLSGGMQTSVDQAVDLSVMTVIQRRSGAAPGWIALDEIFEGQPPKTKEAAMEVLEEFAKDRLVLVVDHGSEFQAMFKNRINVELKDGRSIVS